MFSIPDGINNLKELSANVTSTLEAFTKNKAPETITNLLKATKTLSAVSGLLGTAGAVLGLFTMFMKSDTQLILEIVSEINKKLDRLKEQMQDKFSMLEVKADSRPIEQDVKNYMTKLNTVFEEVKLYHGKVKAYETKPDEGLLLQIKDSKNILREKRNDCRDAIQGIYDRVTSDGIKNNIFEATYKVTFGDITKITEIGMLLFHYVNFGYMADSLMTTITLEYEDESKDKKNIDYSKNAAESTKFHEKHVKAVVDAMETYINKCNNQIKENSDDFYRYELKEKLSGNTKDRQNDLEIMHQSFSSRYPQVKWLCMIYNPIRGWNEHAFRGNYNYRLSETLNNADVNLIFHWGVPDPEAIKRYNEEEANSYVEQFKKLQTPEGKKFMKDMGFSEPTGIPGRTMEDLPPPPPQFIPIDMVTRTSNNPSGFGQLSIPSRQDDFRNILNAIDHPLVKFMWVGLKNIDMKYKTNSNKYVQQFGGSFTDILRVYF